MGTKVYFFRDNTENWEPVHDYLSGFVSAERREKIDRYKFESDRLLSLYAAVITRLAIVRETGVKNDELVFDCPDMKKPSLSALITNASLDFNFSHTKGAVLIGISTDSTICVDVEQIRKAPFNTMKIVCHPVEADYIISSADKDKAFFEIWTKKEAYTKCMGNGLSVNLKSINTLAAPIYENIETFIQDGSVCSVCTLKKSSFTFFLVSKHVSVERAIISQI